MAQQGLLDFYRPELVNLDKTVTTTEFDVTEFNKDFEAHRENVGHQVSEIEKQRLQEFNKQEQSKSIYNLSLFEIFIGIKDTWFGLFDDLLQQKFYTETFTKDNRIFFIGVTIVLFVTVIYLYNMIFSNFNSDQVDNNKITEIHHIYHNKNISPQKAAKPL